MPLYTIWNAGTWQQIVFAAVHCTGGDVLIALSALTVALMLVGTAAWPRERFGVVTALTVAIGVSYTVFSEYLNIVIRAAWAYSELMPVVSIGGFQVGASPLLQWLVVPSLALLASRQATAAAGCEPYFRREPLPAAIHVGAPEERHATTGSRTAGPASMSCRRITP